MNGVFIIFGLILAASILAFAVSQGQEVTTVQNITLTTYQNVTLPQGGFQFPFSNITGFNVSGIAQANLTGLTLPAGNITNATAFQTSNYTYPGNVSVLQRIIITCPNMTIYTNGTHLILNVTGACS